MKAYNEHYHLVLTPDDIWIAIAVAFARYVDAHADSMRNIFVNHDGQKELVVYGSGDIRSANYRQLVDDMVKQIEQHTKADIRSWMECKFSTTTATTRLVSQIICMASMKNYFSYKMCLCCGLPKVTLKGTKEDWVQIIERLDFLKSLNHEVLTSWAEVLEYVLNNFVDAYDGKIDRDFWNRIAHRTGGGSGPRYLEGWIIAFFPFDDKTTFCLNSLAKIKQGDTFGRINTNDVASCTVFVPVTIDDNGTEYHTQFFAGLLATDVTNKGQTLQPLAGWSLVNVGKQPSVASEPAPKWGVGPPSFNDPNIRFHNDVLKTSVQQKNTQPNKIHFGPPSFDNSNIRFHSDVLKTSDQFESSSFGNLTDVYNTDTLKFLDQQFNTRPINDQFGPPSFDDPNVRFHSDVLKTSGQQIDTQPLNGQFGFPSFDPNGKFYFE